MADINMMKEIIRGFGSCGKFSSNKWMNSVVYVTPPLLLLLYNLRQGRKGKFNLIDLPDDLIVDILTRLPIKSLCCILCASKSFSNRVAIDRPLFATLHMSRLLNSGINSVAEEPPQLLLFSRPVGNLFNEIHLQPLKYNIDKFDLVKPNYNLLVSKINLTPLLFKVGFVYFNLFFFKGLMHCTPCFLLNPHKEEVLRIPTAAVRGDIVYEDWYGMGFDNTTNTHKIVYVNIIKKYNQAVSHVYELGRQSSCSWRQIQAVPPCCLSNKNLCSNGDMHWLVNGTRSTDTTERGRSHIISFDFKKDEFCYTPHPTFEKFDLDDFHLVNLKGSITLVRTSFENDVEIWVMKNYIKKEWSLDYKMSIQIERGPVSNCGEWKNGIFLELDNGDMTLCRPSVYYFMDLQHNFIKRLVKSWTGVDKITFSYTGSLISLKDFGNLVQTTIDGTVCTWS